MPAQACYRNLKATDINKTGMLGKKCLQSAQTSCKLTNTSCFIRPALEVPGNWPCSKPAIRVHAKSVLAATGQKWRSPQRRLHKSVPGNQGWQYHVHHAEKQSELAHWTMRKLVPGDRGGENSRLKLVYLHSGDFKVDTQNLTCMHICIFPHLFHTSQSRSSQGSIYSKRNNPASETVLLICKWNNKAALLAIKASLRSLIHCQSVPAASILANKSKVMSSRIW